MKVRRKKRSHPIHHFNSTLSDNLKSSNLTRKFKNEAVPKPKKIKINEHVEPFSAGLQKISPVLASKRRKIVQKSYTLEEFKQRRQRSQSSEESSSSRKEAEVPLNKYQLGELKGISKYSVIFKALVNADGRAVVVKRIKIPEN